MIVAACCVVVVVVVECCSDHFLDVSIFCPPDSCTSSDSDCSTPSFFVLCASIRIIFGCRSEHNDSNVEHCELTRKIFGIACVVLSKVDEISTISLVYEFSVIESQFVEWSVPRSIHIHKSETVASDL